MARNFARYVANLRQSFFDEEILNEQFLELEKVEASSSLFLDGFCTEYFKEADRFYSLMMTELYGPPPYSSHLMEILLDRNRRRTTYLGAVKVTHQIDCMKSSLRSEDLEACKIAFEGMRRENEILQLKLEKYFKLRKQSPPSEIEDKPEFGYMDIDSE